jgi:hypothetical protein
MDLSKTQLTESVFAGGGEMGARIRAFDWSTTVLGPWEQWSQALRICVRIVLGPGYPMVIFWGRDYTTLYNDACACRWAKQSTRRVGPQLPRGVC